MDGFQLSDYSRVEISVAMTESIDSTLADHLDKGPRQEDLTFAYWRPARGASRFTALLYEVVLPEVHDRILQGNVMFTSEYLHRVLGQVPQGSGIALLHSHLGPGWQGMSDDDEVAERDRLGGAVAGRTNLPVLGLTRGTDGTWSARIWARAGRNRYARIWARTVRVVGRRLRISYHPELRPLLETTPSQQATVSVWGGAAQADLVRARVGIVGLGSVGSIVAEGLSRLGVEDLKYIDHDHVEDRNLDRMLGATAADAIDHTPKVEVARRLAETSHTSPRFHTQPVHASLLSPEGLRAALDCDALLSCVDRPWPRSVMNTLAKAHLIPVVDGGILARVDAHGLPLHIDWRIHSVGPQRRCMYCLHAVLRSDVALDMEGKLDDPDYLRGLSEADRQRFSRRNVFPFSLSVASHQILQLVGLATGMARVGGVGSQHYAGYPGIMTVDESAQCDADCEVDALTLAGIDLVASLPGPQEVQLPQNTVFCSHCGTPRPIELTTGSPRTPCPKCGEMAIRIAVNLQSELSFDVSLSIAMKPGDQSRGWRRRWEEMERELKAISGQLPGPLSASAIHAARHRLHSFYVQSYHLKDALKEEASTIGIAAGSVEAVISQSPELALLADLANLDKHGNLNRPARSGHIPRVTSIEGRSLDSPPGSWRLFMTIEHGGRALDGVSVAEDAVSAWRHALRSWGLI